MKKRKNYTEGIRANIWIPPKHRKLWESLENKSGFVSIALSDAVGIMTWALLKKDDPDVFRGSQAKIEDVLPKFNQEFPLDEMTQKRLGKWQGNSQNKQELW